MSINSSTEAAQKEREASDTPTDSASESRDYSEGTKMFQQMERGFARASYRIAKGFADGIETYYEESEKSAQEKQDGAARDFLQNSAAGFSAAMGEMSKAPLEIAKATDSGAAWEFAQSVGKSVSRVVRPDDKEKGKADEGEDDAARDGEKIDT